MNIVKMVEDRIVNELPQGRELLESDELRDMTILVRQLQETIRIPFTDFRKLEQEKLEGCLEMLDRLEKANSVEVIAETIRKGMRWIIDFDRRTVEAELLRRRKENLPRQ